MRQLLPVLLAIGVAAGAAVPPLQAQRQQPGATQGGPTTGDEMMPPFDLRYFLGDWEIEWSPLDTPLLPGGKYTGVERVRHIADGRYLEVTVELEGQDRSLRGRGILFLETGPFGAHLTKYVVGLEPSESRRLLDLLFRHIELPRFVWTHHWQIDDLVVWDNRCTMHRREGFPSRERRLLKRTQVFNDQTPRE